MPLTPNPASFLHCTRDEFTEVRATTGELLGCVPRVPDDALAITDSAGAGHELRYALRVCVCVDLDHGATPLALNGFVPLDSTHADLATPAVSTEEDLATGV